MALESHGPLAAALALSPVASQTALAQQNVGSARIVVNDVRGVIGQNQPAPLRAGIDVFQNETIRTGDLSASRVIFQDNTNLSVGAGSQVVLDRFVFDPDPARSQVALSIARGAVRFATGSLPKSAYRISTPAATIGIRGTILTIIVAADGTTFISVDEGIAIVPSGGQTVSVSAGMTTTVSVGAPPSPPNPTPPGTPPAVAQMDTLIARAELAPGGAAGGAAAGFSTPLTIGILAALAAVGIGIAASDNNSQPSTTTSSTAP